MQKLANIPTQKIIVQLTQEQFEYQTEKQKSNSGACLGVIINNENQVILINKRSPSSCWVLPGGRIEKGEDFKTCFIREIIEEIGITLDSPKLFLVEEKTFINPNGDKLPPFSVAFFWDKVNIEKLPKRSTIAINENIKAKIFSLDSLPDMVLDDRKKIDSIIKLICQK